ncbi:hypothetical protein SAMN02745724_02719 [Pseudoalteromonas denitrificans DSM 6059]|uniref:GAF domain-containing protein n=2 Tax=Pseudoalteromonas TaxID=53246 RepID=A0A1I1MJH5_9GAMM|nr:GAF domain-containing protein [Pseudoalteromonas denitrificans]SFC85557.1 hypothetical protein SAMN02745724_02719 [Pseudoalteromonas denitrificans DSM 6059]
MLGYLNTIQVECDQHLVNEHIKSLTQYIASEAKTKEIVWEYQIPELGEGGSCSLFGELQKEPFDLKSILLKNQKTIEHELFECMNALTKIVTYVSQKTNLDWFGIYQKRFVLSETELVKLAYHGAPSRPLFPLTSEFAKLSNNVQVALTKKGRIINDIPKYQSSGGEYYICDPKVKSEVCLPILTASGEMLGIIDAEAFKVDFFDENTLALLIAACLLIPNYLPA